jgi:hypothetical protein
MKVRFFGRISLLTRPRSKERTMPSTHHLSSDATAAALPPITPQALVDAFAAARDPRSRQGQRFTVAALLTLAVAAMLANHRSPLAIAPWGAGQDAASKRAMRFPQQGVTPHQSTGTLAR